MVEVYKIYRYVYTELDEVSFVSEVKCEASGKKYHTFTLLQVKKLKEQGHTVIVGDLELVYNWNFKLVDGWFEKGGVSPELMDLFNYIQENGADFMFENSNPRNQRKIKSINEAVNQFLATLD